jgi:hypothetical protein
VKIRMTYQPGNLVMVPWLDAVVEGCGCYLGRAILDGAAPIEVAAEMAAELADSHGVTAGEVHIAADGRDLVVEVDTRGASV